MPKYNVVSSSCFCQLHLLSTRRAPKYVPGPFGIMLMAFHLVRSISRTLATGNQCIFQWPSLQTNTVSRFRRPLPDTASPGNLLSQISKSQSSIFGCIGRVKGEMEGVNIKTLIPRKALDARHLNTCIKMTKLIT